MPTRREVLAGGCAALVALAVPSVAEAAPRYAPRRTCPHRGCRYHRPDSKPPGLCGLSLHAHRVIESEVTP